MTPVRGTQRIGGDLARHGASRRRCDSCGREGRLTYSPLHDAHFCAECLVREVPDPEAGALNEGSGPRDQPPRTSMTAAQLRKAEARYQRSKARAEDDRERRNTAVLAALAEGWTQAQIAKTLDLTATRIHQIVKAARGS